MVNEIARKILELDHFELVRVLKALDMENSEAYALLCDMIEDL